MILILNSDIDSNGPEFEQLIEYLNSLEGIEFRVHQVQGAEQLLTEIYLLGSTASLSLDDMKRLPGVARAVRVSEAYRILGRHKDDDRPAGFEYNGVQFGQDTLHIFAGLCAVDTSEHVEAMMRALRDNGQVCTRMGAYKPRTSPYSFQGHGSRCLPYVFA